jgi:hypothetical protein
MLSLKARIKDEAFRLAFVSKITKDCGIIITYTSDPSQS